MKPLSAAATDPAVLARSQALTPMGRLGTPDEIAELVAWLSSNAVSFSPGAVYDAYMSNRRVERLLDEVSDLLQRRRASPPSA